MNQTTQTFVLPAAVAPTRLVLDPDTWLLAEMSIGPSATP
jgi:hypothetical protein